jgi:PBP4 family serine-type D-alanyl-D-alanine carboxypeptidase
MLIQIIISLFLSVGLLYGQTGPSKNIDKTISLLPSGTQFSLLLLDADNNRIIIEKTSALPLKPASNIKLFTTGISLLYFGNDYKIKTSIYFDKEKITGGVLNGNIYMKGFGNALLNTYGLDYMINQMEKAGIKEIKGRIIYDNSFFKVISSGKEVTSSLSPLDVPAVSPLSINRNIIELTITRTGHGVKLASSPSSKYIPVINNVSAGGSKSKPDALLKEGEKEYKIILNRVPAGLKDKKIYFFLKSPARLAALLLMEKLEKRGIKLPQLPVEGSASQSKFTEISSFVLLADYIKETNKKSNNFLAEELKNIFTSGFAPAAGLRQREKPEISFLKTLGVPTENLDFVDGSGISPRNRVTAKALVSLLSKIYSRPEQYKAFKESLSAAGVDGTMKERFFNSPIKNHFFGKTGFMSGASSISGYMRTKGGKNMIVSILINYKQKGIEYYEGIEKEILEMIYKNY